MISTKKSLIVLAPALAYLLFIAALSRGFFMDDAFIGFRYVQNLIAGNGLVFNPGERVEGITNLGWLLVLTPFSYLLEITIAAKILGLVCAAAAVVLAYLVALRVNRGKSFWLLVAPVPMLIAVQFDFAYFSLSGMETGLLAALLAAAAYLVAIDRGPYLLGFILAFAFLVHPETVLVFPLFLAFISAAEPRELRQYYRAAGVFLACIGAFTLGRYLYFHDLLPHTFYAKPSPLKSMVKELQLAAKGWDTNFSPPYSGLLALAFMMLGGVSLYQKSRRPALFMAAATVTAAVFAVYAPEDWTYMGRYFAPCVPLAAILFWRGLVDAHEALLQGMTARGRIRALLLGYFLIILCVGFSDAFLHLRDASTDRYPGYVLTSRGLKAPARWIRDNVPDSAVIASRRIGALGYYSEKKIFDWKFGLVDREIAALRQSSGAEFNYPTHPALQEVWPRRAPAYVLEDSHVIKAIINENKGSEERFEIHGIPYRVLKKFKIGADVDWVLCERI